MCTNAQISHLHCSHITPLCILRCRAPPNRCLRRSALTPDSSRCPKCNPGQLPSKKLERAEEGVTAHVAMIVSCVMEKVLVSPAGRCMNGTGEEIVATSSLRLDLSVQGHGSHISAVSMVRGCDMGFRSSTKLADCYENCLVKMVFVDSV
jgi:hypothetical protein